MDERAIFGAIKSIDVHNLRSLLSLATSDELDCTRLRRNSCGPASRTPLQGLQMIQQQLRHQLQGARQAKMPANEVNEVKETPTAACERSIGGTLLGHSHAVSHAWPLCASLTAVGTLTGLSTSVWAANVSVDAKIRRRDVQHGCMRSA